MASRDYEKYLHLTITIEKGSPTHLALLKDAQEIGATKQLPTVAAAALKNYYAGMRSTQPATGEQESTSAHLNGKATDVIVKNTATAEANADAALDEWA